MTNRITWLVSFFLGFVLIAATFNGVISITHTPAPSSQSFEFSLLVGTDHNSTGRYAGEAPSLFESWPPESSRRYALITGIHNIIDSPSRFCRLVVAKIGVMWGGDYEAIEWATVNGIDGGHIIPMKEVSLFAKISHYYYMILLFFGAVGAYLLSKESTKRSICIYPLILISIFIAHSFLEVQQRYHLPFVFIIIIFAAWPLSRLLYDASQEHYVSWPLSEDIGSPDPYEEG